MDRRAGFTLIEVIGAFFMMTIILIIVTGIFVENGRQRSAATELMRVWTTGTSALDLVAQDLEGAIYLAPPRASNARDHSWGFLADRAGPLGARYLRFQTQNVPRDNLGEHGTTWVDVVYFLTEEEERDRFTLWRWRSTRPPGVRDSTDPDEDDPASARIAEGLSDFGVSFVGPEGETLDDWDSAYFPAESPLPLSAEIKLSLYRLAREGEAEGDDLEIPSEVLSRFVSLPMHRPVDVDALIDIALDSAEEGQACGTVQDCLTVSTGETQWYQTQLQSDCGGDIDLCDALQDAGATCWSEIDADWPDVASQAPALCEDLL